MRFRDWRSVAQFPCSNRAPGETMTRRPRETLTATGAAYRPHARLGAHWRDQDYVSAGGQIEDASIVATSRQGLTGIGRASAKREGIPGGRTPRRHCPTRPTAMPGGPRRSRRQRGAHGAPMALVSRCRNLIPTDRRHGSRRRRSAMDAARHDAREPPAPPDRAPTAPPVRVGTAQRPRRNAAPIIAAAPVSTAPFTRARRGVRPAPRKQADTIRPKGRVATGRGSGERRDRPGPLVRALSLVRVRAAAGPASPAGNLHRASPTRDRSGRRMARQTDRPDASPKPASPNRRLRAADQLSTRHRRPKEFCAPHCCPGLVNCGHKSEMPQAGRGDRRCAVRGCVCVVPPICRTLSAPGASSGARDAAADGCGARLSPDRQAE